MQKLVLQVLALLLLCCPALRAQIVKSKGRGEIAYTSAFRPSAAEERAAIQKARQDALARYAATLPKARFELFRSIESQLAAKLEALVPTYVVIDESIDKTSKRYLVSIEASINTSLIESELQAMSKAAKAAPATASADAAGANAVPSSVNDSFIAFVFIARELATNRAYGPEVSTSAAVNTVRNVDRSSDAAAAGRRERASSANTDSNARATDAVAASGAAGVSASGSRNAAETAATRAVNAPESTHAAAQLSTRSDEKRTGQSAAINSSSTDREVSLTATDARSSATSGSATLRSQDSARVADSREIKTTESRSVETRADDRTFRVYSITSIDAAVNHVLTEAGYEAVNAIDAGLDAAAFRRDYGSGNDVSAETRTNAVRHCRDQSIAYLATATLDVGLPEIDPASGQTRVTVTVTAQVSDTRGRFPRTIASVSGKPYAQLGTNAMVARENALLEAARQTAAQLVDQLRLKRVP